MSRVLLVEINATSPAGAPTVLRFADRAIRPFPPTDPDRPNARFDSRILEPPALRRLLFEDLSTLTPSLGVGVLQLANADHGLDGYQGYVWSDITALLWTEGTAFAAATTVYKGLCAPPSFPVGGDRPSRVSLALYDYRLELSKPLQSNVYAGTNGVGGVLYEGAPDGIKGQPKPLAYGNLLDAHIAAPQVNAAVQAYQLHDGKIAGAEQLFDRGAAAGYASDGDFANAAFEGHANAAAHYCTDLGRGLVKLTGAPAGQLTFGFKGDAPAVGGYKETAGPILARILAKAGVPAGRIGASVGALAAAAVVGIYVADGANADQVVAQMAASALTAVLPDRLGVWQAVPFGPPAAVADFQLGRGQIIDCVSDDGAPLPVGEVRVGWGQIWQTFSGTELFPGLVGTTSQERLANEFRWAVASDATVKARLESSWRKVEVKTALRTEADALALANALKAMFGLRPDGTPRRTWRVTVELDTALVRTPGQTVQLAYPPSGVAGNFLLVGEELLRPRRDQAIWTVWG